MFSIGIKPDDCEFKIETLGNKGYLHYVEYFNITKNIITDRYITDTFAYVIFYYLIRVCLNYI